MPAKSLNLSIAIFKPSESQDFTFDDSFDQSHTFAAPPSAAPPTTLFMPKDLFPVNEACESCDACIALAGQPCQRKMRRESTNGLGSASSTRRRVTLDTQRPASPTTRNTGAQGPYRRHPSILPIRHKGSGCRTPNSLSMSSEPDMYDTPRSTSVSIESTPATTPTDERSTDDLDHPLRSSSLGSMSLGSTSQLDLSASTSAKSAGLKFKFIDRSFF